MQTFDRMGIHLEQCDRCKGIFLDRGELESIITAEQRHYGGGGGGHVPAYSDSPRPHKPHGRPDSPGPFGGHRGGYRDSPRPYGGGYSDSPRPYGQKRRKSFLENLFD